jgi:alpha-glucosidase (family GH31 glycosyl hydrolase)
MLRKFLHRLIIALNDEGTASGTVYNDDGDGFEYRDGQYLKTKYFCKRVNNEVIISISEEGKYPRSTLPLKITIIISDTQHFTQTFHKYESNILFPLVQK